MDIFCPIDISVVHAPPNGANRSYPFMNHVRGVGQNGDEPTDDELVEATLAGDDAAFTELFLRHRAMVRGLTSSMLLGRVAPTDFEDAVQETFLRARRGLPSFRGDAKFSTWLYRICENVCRGVVAQRQPELFGLEWESPRHARPGPEPALDLRAALEALPPRCRTAALLVWADGRSVVASAGRMRITPRQVRNHLDRARTVLAEASDEPWADDYLRLVLSEAVDRLPRQLSEVARLRWQAGLTAAEIAEHEDRSVNLVRDLLAQARARLVKRLEARGWHVASFEQYLPQEGDRER